MRFDCNKHRIDVSQLLVVIEAQNPAAVGFAVHIQNAEVHGAGFFAEFRVFLPPDLEDAGVLYSGLMIEVEGVEDQRLILRVEDAAEGLAGAAAAVYIEYAGY